MTSQIVSATIDEDFPLAGQDNDSQGFRDNFTVIKTGLATATSELTDLQNNVILKGPIGDMIPTDIDNNFNETLIYNVRTNTVYGTVYTTTTTNGLTTIDIGNGEYQVITLDRNSTLRFENWPDPSIGDVFSKIRVVFKTDGTGDYIVTFTTQGGVLTPLEGSSDAYTTGTDPGIIQVIDAWSADNGDNVYLVVVGEFSTTITVSDLNSIGNVDISIPTNGQVLKFNGTNWVNSADLGLLSVSLNNVTDVNLTTPIDGQFLKFNGTTWVNSAVLTSLDDVPGVALTAPSTGQVLKFNGTEWVNDNESVNNWAGSELVSDAGGVDPTKSAGYFNTGIGPTDEVSILGAGVDGQVKVFAMNLYGGANMAMEVTNAAWGGAGRITFNSVGQGCTLQYFNNKWFCVGNNGATFT